MTDPSTRDRKRADFAELHRRKDAFVLANAWDIGSARMLAGLGAEAIGTSSSAWAFTLGKPDATGARDAAVAHAAELDAATPLPVSADLEDGYGASPEEAAATVAAAAAAGIAGCSIEDTVLGQGKAYDFDAALARIRACVAAAQAASRPEAPFLLTARADGVLAGAYDLAEAIRRIQAFEEAGADVLFIPVPGDLDAVRRVCSAVARPVNVGAFGPQGRVPIAELAAAGAQRISLGSMLMRIAQGAILEAAERVLAQGPVDPEGKSASGRQIDALLAKGSA